jgi:predicted Ser/Thr protein kinase
LAFPQKLFVPRDIIKGLVVMIDGPQALETGTLVGGRFEIERVLGRGGFGIAYLAYDKVRRDQATIKELAPFGCLRSDAGVVELESGGVSAHRLRQSFLEEARLLSRLNLPGILPVRAVFAENGTAYYATDHLAEAETLERVLLQEGRMDPAGAMDIVFQLLETLEAVHAKGILHRDVKPSNVLISPKGQAYLIDFGSAREWHADEATRHTVLYTPGYAPIEQLSERGRRGPATDLYGLCATAYRMLTGSIPMPATERVNGAELTPLRLLRPDVELPIAAAIESGLEVKYHDRPQTIAQFREALSDASVEEDEGSLAAYDAKLLRLQQFGFERRQCPACGGVLEQPKPLRKWGCPVCRDGVIRKRDITSRLCPSCQVGTLHKRPNDKPLGFCPLCITGEFAQRRQGLVKRKLFLDCMGCKAIFEVLNEGIAVISPPEQVSEPKSGPEWRDISGRSAEVWACDGCEAQYDLLEDGRWGQFVPSPKRYKALYPEEWARVAMGLPPGAGNAACDVCHADYFVDDNRLTLLTTENDLHGFGAEHLGRLVDADDARWLGVGKASPNPGYVCNECGTELDIDGDYLRLVNTRHRQLIRQVGELRKLVDWHRVAAGLPEVHEEQEFRTDVSTAIQYAYEEGEIGFDSKNEVLWKGPGSRDRQAGTLSIAKGEILFGGMIKKWRVPLDAVVGASGSGDSLELRLSGEDEPVLFEITPVELTVHLNSGNKSVMLNAESLARRLAVKGR